MNLLKTAQVVVGLHKSTITSRIQVSVKFELTYRTCVIRHHLTKPVTGMSAMQSVSLPGELNRAYTRWTL